MNKTEWEKQRRKAQKLGGYRMTDTFSVRLALTSAEIAKHIKETECKVELGDKWTGVISHLKAAVYMNDIPNTRKALLNAITDYDVQYREMFDKRFWEEYVYQWSIYNEDGRYEDYIKNAKTLNEIKDYLDAHQKYHSFSGSDYQNNQKFYKVITKIVGGHGFSMRAWGALMAAYMNSKEKNRKYSYIDYYC